MFKTIIIVSGLIFFTDVFSALKYGIIGSDTETEGAY